jgi:CO dehydrogenase/acetyl-CoA synthase delta subunit
LNEPQISEIIKNAERYAKLIKRYAMNMVELHVLAALPSRKDPPVSVG